jgi:hypothetical protein
MQASENQRIGRFVVSMFAGETVRAYVPPPLPPTPPVRLGRPAASVLRVFQYAKTHPILSIAATAEKIESTFPTVAAAIEHLKRLGILHEITGRQRHRLFAYRGYMDILNEGTQPLR